MFHKSKLEKFGGDFPHDKKGHVPHRVDCWRKMDFDHSEQDPNEEGISEEEKARRTEYLDKQWWPKILANVQDEHERLTSEHGETFVQHWDNMVNEPPHLQHGFDPG